MGVKEADLSLSGLMAKQKASILHRWTGLVFETYQPDTATMLKARGDRFANPVSYNVSYNLGMVLDGLISGQEAGTLFPYLEDVIKVRAVQDFTPESATSFMVLLKKAIASEVNAGKGAPLFKQDLAVLEKRIDLLSDACSDIYTECRRRIENIKAGEKRKAAANMSRLMGTSENGI